MNRTKIYITGCAKTGTTLVRRLFNAFDLNVYNYDEASLRYFIRSDKNVAKRNAGAPFSHQYSTEASLRNDLQLIKANDISIVNVTRSREDTLKSSNSYVSPERYDECERQAKEYADHIAVTIEYEKLVADPDLVQQEVADTLGLEILHKWSDYPNFVNIAQEHYHTHEGRYKPRPIE